MKVISFCLYGNNPKYTFGAIYNTEAAKEVYPDFLCYIYHDNSVPKSIIDTLSAASNVRLLNMSGKQVPPMMWRFLAIDEDNVELFISRDTDSRLSKREQGIVETWINSENKFMSIKDHPISHKGIKLLGGLWGMKKIKDFKMSEVISEWINQKKPTDYSKYNLDQMFLQEAIYPLTTDSLSYFDDYNNDKLPFCQKIPFKRKNWEFIGEIFDENNRRSNEYKMLRGYHIRKLGLAGKAIARIIEFFD